MCERIRIIMFNTQNQIMFSFSNAPFLTSGKEVMVFAGKFKFEWLPCWNRRGCACSEGACIGPSHDGACSGTGDVEADGARR